MSEICYYACKLAKSKHKVLLAVCYTEKKSEQSYEFLLTIPVQDFCDYNAKKYKDKKVDLEDKALIKIKKLWPSVDCHLQHSY